MALIDEVQPAGDRKKPFRTFFDDVHNKAVGGISLTLDNMDSLQSAYLFDAIYTDVQRAEIKRYVQYVLENYCVSVFEFFDENADGFNISCPDGAVTKYFNEGVEGEIAGYMLDTDYRKKKDGIISSYAGDSIISKVLSEL